MEDKEQDKTEVELLVDYEEGSERENDGKEKEEGTRMKEMEEELWVRRKEGGEEERGGGERLGKA